MRYSIFALTGAVAGAMALLGCASTDGGDGDKTEITEGAQDGVGTPAPEFPTGTGQAPRAQKAYPAAPYGIGKNSTVQNFKFVGFPNFMKDGTALKNIELAEFYNPTGDGVFEEGSVFEVGAPKPKGLLIDVSSVWCGPCNYEADQVLPGLYAKYKPMGGEILLQLFDGATVGKPATSKSLYNWSNKYDLDYPGVVDPSGKLSTLFKADAFPTNIIVNTRTMKIVEVIAGAPEPGGTFFKTFEKVLAGTL